MRMKVLLAQPRGFALGGFFIHRKAISALGTGAVQRLFGAQHRILAGTGGMRQPNRADRTGGGNLAAADFNRVLAHGAYVMGPEVRAFEEQLAGFCGAAHAVSCANGTEALALPLMAWEIGPGDAVFCPSFSFAATGEVIPWFGASPVFVDVRPTVGRAVDPVQAAHRPATEGGFRDFDI